MQIDFHHTVTYVVARLAGFTHDDADIVAYASQYVDDATSSGTVQFDNKALYNRISSAHKMLDARNIMALKNHQVWLPFHFLPGNGGLEAGQHSHGPFIEKIICTPNSPVAEEMVRQVILDKDRPYGLHRLGVAMHVYADTWAHQGFAGVLHEVNEVEDAAESETPGGILTGCMALFNDILDDTIPPLGHGRARSFPDMPFLSWKYRNYKKESVTRNNTKLFCTAANQLYKAMQRFIQGDPDAQAYDLDDSELAKIIDLFVTINHDDGEKRHKKWLEEIANGKFNFGPVDLKYSPRGRQSWKHQSLNSSHDQPVYTYKDDFLDSNWKLFHDAIQAHRFYVVHDLLPKYGICAA